MAMEESVMDTVRRISKHQVSNYVIFVIVSMAFNLNFSYSISFLFLLFFSFAFVLQDGRTMIAMIEEWGIW